VNQNEEQQQQQSLAGQGIVGDPMTDAILERWHRQRAAREADLRRGWERLHQPADAELQGLMAEVGRALPPKL
jgi:hypothetical protein